MLDIFLNSLNTCAAILVYFRCLGYCLGVGFGCGKVCVGYGLQEELGFMLEVLGLREDALIQYDELDAMFDQFVENHANGGQFDLLSLKDKVKY